MPRTTKTLSSAVTWGALWGVFEATVGHILHITHLKLGWLFWYPVAFFCMHRAYLATGTPHVAWGAAIVAASVKLIDLIAPARLDYVINPAVSILLEGAAVSMAFALYARSGKKWGHMVSAIVLASLGWRGLYLLYAWLVMPPSWQAISPLASSQALIKFAVTGSLANMAPILLYAGLVGMDYKEATEAEKPGVWQSIGSALLLVGAMVIQRKL